MVQVVVEVPEGALASLRQDPAQFSRELRLAAAVKWYEMHLLSQGRAAEIAGLSRAEFIAALARFGVTPFQTSVDELAQEAERV
jgi:predicted HTH domain antitoxin